MVRKNNKNSIGISLPKEFVKIVDKIIKIYPDFKNRTGVIRYAVRKYYDETMGIKRIKR